MAVRFEQIDRGLHALKSYLWRATSYSTVYLFNTKFAGHRSTIITRTRDRDKAVLLAASIRSAKTGYVSVVTKSWLFDLFRRSSKKGRKWQ